MDSYTELDFAAMSSKLEPQRHCDLTVLVTPTHWFSGYRRDKPGAGRMVTSPVSSDPSGMGSSLNLGQPVKLNFRLAGNKHQCKYIPGAIWDILTLKKMGIQIQLDMHCFI